MTYNDGPEYDGYFVLGDREGFGIMRFFIEGYIELCIAGLVTIYMMYNPS